MVTSNRFFSPIRWKAMKSQSLQLCEAMVMDSRKGASSLNCLQEVIGHEGRISFACSLSSLRKKEYCLTQSMSGPSPKHNYLSLQRTSNVIYMNKASWMEMDIRQKRNIYLKSSHFILLSTITNPIFVKFHIPWEIIDFSEGRSVNNSRRICLLAIFKHRSEYLISWPLLSKVVL